MVMERLAAAKSLPANKTRERQTAIRQARELLVDVIVDPGPLTAENVDMGIYVTSAEAASILNRNISLVRKHLREGRISGFKADKQWFVDRKSLSEFKPNKVGRPRNK